jgi:hypothetical protein
MGVQRQLEINVQWHGHKSTVRVDGESFFVDRAVIDSSAQHGVTVVELRYLKMGGEPFHVQGRLQPTYVGNTSRWGAPAEAHYEAMDIDLLIQGPARTTTCTINGELLKEAYRTVVTLDRQQRTHIEIYYSTVVNNALQLCVIEGDMLPPVEDAR